MVSSAHQTHAQRLRFNTPTSYPNAHPMFTPLICGSTGSLIGSPATLASQHFYSMSECVHLVLRQLPWTSLVAMSHTGRNGRDRARQIMRSRMLEVLSCYITLPQLEAFLATLKATHSGIAGSVPWSIITTDIILSDNDQPHDINVLTPRGTTPEWVDVMRLIGFTSLEVIACYDGLETRCRRVLRFQNKEHRTITVTESLNSSILPLLLASSVTSQMNLITSSRIYCFYPSLSSACRSVGSTYTVPSLATVKIMTQRLIRFHMGTRYARLPCAEACPAVWRHTFGLPNVGQVAWGGLFNVDDVAGNMQDSDDALTKTHYKWKIGSVCTNEDCTYNSCEADEPFFL
ncbi:hypothetical protein FPV67DRAFT_1673852 [Lyophyllum atratum]|nr:hypothetical protein FPV67DRAFT_1673852 [Lyophyllum atratum]